MKIVHLCLSSVYIDNHTYQENMLPKYHVLQGHDVTVIASLVSFDSNGRPCLLEKESVHQTKEGYKVIRVDYKKIFYKLNKFIRRYNDISILLENEKPDLIFIHDFSFIDIYKVIRYVSKNKNIVVYVDCHTDYINSAKTWISKNLFHHFIWRHYAKLLTPFVKMYYGVTPLRCDFLRDAYKIPEKKIQLLVMGVDDEMLKQKDHTLIRQQNRNNLSLNPTDFVILTGGKIDMVKNIHLVMGAVNKLENQNVKLVVFGTVDPKMKEYFDELLKSDKIIFIGWLNSEAIMDLFISSDLIVFPGTHSVMWEQAVGVGVPCVFKYWEGMTHVDVGGNCEFLYQDSEQEMLEVLNKIIDDKEKYDLMKSVAIAKGLNYFSYSEIAYRAINQ